MVYRILESASPFHFHVAFCVELLGNVVFISLILDGNFVSHSLSSGNSAWISRDERGAACE